jgi:hypothetical protein
MGNLFANRISNSRNIRTIGTGEVTTEFGVVYSVILDETHPDIAQKSNKMAYIGAIKFRELNNFTSNESELPLALKLDSNTNNLPTVNEIVKIVKNGAGIFYQRMYPSDNQNTNAVINQISTKREDKQEDKAPEGNIQNIRNVQATGITKTNQDLSSKFDKFGDYFKFEPGIHKLKLYEGDTTIESRFGQSIRFSGYNNPGRVFAPTTIIRNGENSISKASGPDVTTTEDINRDGTIIAMTSGQYELGFQPGVVDKNGTSDFATKPNSFDSYPQKLSGDQLLLNSGRIILSSKSGELIFYSKKNYGFISDGGLSIDNKLGIDVTVGDDIFVMTNDRNVNFYTGKGSIFLGNQELEPMVKGQQLVDLLVELLEAVVNMQFLTPAGPTKIGPENKPKFDEISGKLNNILSKQNQTS